MTYQYSVAVRNAKLDAVETACGVSAVLKIFSGVEPANCAAADPAGLLCTIQLPSDWLAAASAGTKAKLGAWSGAAGAPGIAASWRIYDQPGTTCHVQGDHSALWQASRSYIVNEKASNGVNLYICTTAGTSAASGGPSGTGNGIVDGGAVWNFARAGTGDVTLDNTNIASGQTITVNSFTLTAGNA